MKKILLSVGAVGAAIAMLPMFAAFEAHVVNVTAAIENALSVSTYSLDFGTVFPQEKFDKPFNISLSSSFNNTERVDDVEYMLRQKPKCRLPEGYQGESLPEFGQVRENGNNFYCPDPYVMMPFLCPYLSKQEISADGTATNGENDMLVGLGGHAGPLYSFHGPISVGPGPDGWNLQTTLAYQLNGRLAKSQQDISDTWNIDLKVPCFGSQCAQDWAEFVAQNGGTQNQANPASYIQPPANEHELFGCDLWMEVKGISYTPLGCNAKADVMLVLDRSGSISGQEQTDLEAAAQAFVTAMAPSTAGVHMGQSSFASTGSLDQILTDNAAAMNTAITGLSYGGSTDLEAGITLATGELTGGNDRDDSTSPDIMVIITDGNPNVPSEAQAAIDAANAADAARAAGIQVFVVGVGNDVDAAYLINSVADDPAHYFAAANFDDLEAILNAIANCQEPPQITGKLTLIKEVLGGGNKTADDFTGTANNILIDWNTQTNLLAGTYTLSETPLDPNYDLTFGGDADCADGSIDLSVGEEISCTLTNTYDPQPVTLFSDNFNDGNYNGWTANCWQSGGSGTESCSSPTNDVTVISGGDAYSGSSLRMEDDAGVYRNFSTAGYEDIQVKYCRRTSSVSSGDRLRIGWKTGSTSTSWASYTQLEEVNDGTWTCVTWNLPASADNSSISLALFLDNGEGDYGLVDNVEVVGISQ